MRRAFVLLAVVGAMVLGFSGVVMAQSSGGGTPPKTPTDKIPDRYIVVLDDDVSDPSEVARQHANEHGLQTGFVYRHAIKGYSATIPNERALQRVRNEDGVKYIEQDGVVNAVAQTLPWGIDKIGADASSTKAGDGSGSVSNVNAYIIDSGIDQNHSDLNVVHHVNFAGGRNTDCNGHGTHVAGTAAAKDNTSDVVGVAPDTPLIGVKVLGCSGSGTWSGVIKGVDYVTGHNSGTNKKVANMSLGGGANNAVDDAVRRSAAKGVFYALAAGNDGADACKSSPARAGAGTNNGIMTVAATNSSDAETSWSNYGKCVDIWAPGASILSTRKGGGTTTMSGTSMASPHGAGGGALYLSSHTSASSSTVESALKSAATTTGNKSEDGRTITREYVASF